MAERVIYVVHQSRGRLRLRLALLRDERELAEAIADQLSALDGVESVEVRPFTGSVLCAYDGWALQPDRLIDSVRALAQADRVVGENEERPAEVEREMVRSARLNGSGVARAASTFVEELDLEVLRATNGGLNLGTLAALGFMAAGAAEIVSTGKIPMPPWFNLGWWAFRTFAISEKRTLDDVHKTYQSALIAAEDVPS